MQASPTLPVVSVLFLVCLSLLIFQLLYKATGWWNKEVPFRGDSGFWYMIGRRGRMSKYQVLWEWGVFLVMTASLFASGVFFLGALSDPNVFFMRTIGGLVYFLTGGNDIIGVVYSGVALVITWVLSLGGAAT